MLARAEDSLLVVIDMQTTFLAPIWQRERVIARTQFMIACANLLDIPILVTEQVPDKMGGTDPALRDGLKGVQPIAKATFSGWSEQMFRKAINHHKRAQAVIVGIETHICVNQTAHDLMDEDIDAIVCTDAVSARTQDMHEMALRRMADEGAALAHTESVVYEWMQTADHDMFREVLKLVKG